MRASLAIGSLGVTVLLLVPLLPDSWLRPSLWAFEYLRDVPLALRALAVAIAHEV